MTLVDTDNGLDKYIGALLAIYERNKLNDMVPDVRLMGHRQTVQPQMRRRRKQYIRRQKGESF